jgi:hypothetical protein
MYLLAVPHTTSPIAGNCYDTPPYTGALDHASGSMYGLRRPLFIISTWFCMVRYHLFFPVEVVCIKPLFPEKY